MLGLLLINALKQQFFVINTHHQIRAIFFIFAPLKYYWHRSSMDRIEVS